MPRKLLGSLPVKLRIGAACIVLLVMGAWLRPQTAAPLTPSEERAAPLLEQQVQRAATPAAGMADAIATLPARGIVLQRDTGTPVITTDFGLAPSVPPPIFAVAVSDSLLLTHASALTGGSPPSVSGADGAAMPTTVAAFDVATGMVLLRTPSPTGPAPAFADAVPALGSLVIGAAQSRTTNVAIPLFITAISGQTVGVGGSVNSAPPGLPIFNLDGGLLAVGAGDGNAWRIRYVLDRLLPQATNGPLPSSIGISFQVIGEPLAAAIGSSGLAIIDVVPGGPADAARMQPGDVITSVGSEPGADRADLAAAVGALPVGIPVSLSLRRAGRPSIATVTPVPAHEMIAVASDAVAAAGPQARTLFHPDALTASSVPADAIILMIDGRAITSTVEAARELRRTGGAVVVLLEHRGRRFFAVIDNGR